MRARFSILILVVLILGGCITEPVGNEEMYRLGSALTKLSASVESTVRYKDVPEGITDNELLVIATRHDPLLLQPFAEYKLRVNREDRHAIVLVCTPDGGRALLEDAGCSKELDAHHWQSQTSKTCEFTITAQRACAAH